jgi:hypothetical protein
MSYTWDSGTLPTSPVDGVVVNFAVPKGAAAGAHTVTATCGTPIAMDSRAGSNNNNRAGSNNNNSATATFTLTAPDNPPEHPAVTLTPAQGGPATQATATATGFACDAMSVQWQWDDGPLQTPPVGGLVVNFAVPKGAPAGAHTVTATCKNTYDTYLPGAASNNSATATFTLTAPDNPPEHPAVTLTPAQGGPATQTTATATGFACDAMSVQWQWDDGPLQTPPVGGLVVNFAVPKGAPAGAHTVRATCGNPTAKGGSGAGSNNSATATFTLTAPDNTPKTPAVTLTPAQGGPATQTTATATGYACDAMSVQWQWDDGPLQTPPVGGLVVNFAVQKGAAAGAHTVRATCGDSSATATFTVVSASKPALTLNTGHGPGGSHLTASGTGFACGDGNVQLLWDGDTRLADASSGVFSAVPLTIPSDASTGGHMVAASCEHHPDIADSQRFTVTSVTTPVTTTGPAALTLQPASGHQGDQLRATGDGFACANHSGPVDLSWDDGTPLPGASLDPSGHFEASVSVPAKTDARRLTLRATCSDGVVLAADFTVLATPPPPPAPPKIPWLLIVLIVAVAILAAVHYARRRSHKRPEAPPHVQAVPRPDGLPVVTLRETPERGEATHALRLEAHSGLSTLTVREVDR